MAKKENKTNKEKRHFFKDFKAEIKKVIWPTPKQLINTTIAIISMVIVVGAIVFALDLAFDGLNKYGLTKLQEEAQNWNSDTSNEGDSDDSKDAESDSVDSSEDASTSEEQTDNAEN